MIKNRSCVKIVWIYTLKWIKVNVDPHDLLQSVLRKYPKFIILSVPIPFVYRGGTAISPSLISKTSSTEFAINQLIADLHYLQLKSWTWVKAWLQYTEIFISGPLPDISDPTFHLIIENHTKYHDLDDEDFLWSFLGIFEPHSSWTTL